MGFTTGFTGGVTLTLSLAYLSVLAHQRTREQQGQVLRHQALVLQGLIDPFPPLPPPTRSEVAAAQRGKAVEVAKDRWNHEVENAVRWVQHTDWVQVREGLEESVARLWGKTAGETPAESLQRAKDKLAPVDYIEATNTHVANVAKDAYAKAKVEGQQALERTKAEGKEIYEATKGAVGKAVGIAEQAAATSAVKKALDQRYEKPEAKVNKTVADVLKERYTPMDQRDNTQLRGL